MKKNGQKTILLVEDDLATALLNEHVLKGLGYNVVVARSGEEAVRLATGNDKIELVLMDINLGPGMDGTEAARQILAKRHLPIVFLSAHTEKEYVERIKAITRYGYVLKNSGDVVLQSSIEMALDLFAMVQAMQASEARYRALVAGLPDIVVRFDRAGRHLFVSDSVSAVLDLPAAQCIGKTHRELGFPAERCRFWEAAIRRVFESGAPFEGEYTLEGKQGPVIHNVRIVPERNTEGAMRSVLAVIRDITIHRRVEQDYRTLFREMLEGFALHEIICDAQGKPVDYRYLAVNPAFERMTGMKAATLVGRTVMEVLPGTEPYWIETYGKVALTGEPVFFENYSKELHKHFEVTAFRPSPNQFACIFTDVTERKHAAEALQASEVRYRTLVNQASDAIWILDLAANNAGRILLANPAAARMHGYTIAEMEKLKITDLDVPGSVAKAPGRFDTLKQGGKIFGETEHVRKDGTVFPIEFSAVPIEFDGRPCILAFTRDITERKRSEEALNFSKTKLELALQSAKMGMWQFDVIAKKRIFDDQTCFLLGLDSATFRGTAGEFFATMHPDDRAKVKGLLEKTIEQDVPYEPEYRVIWPDASIHYISARGRLLKDAQGNPLVITGTLWDVTERKRSEEEREKLRDKLSQAQKMESVGRLAGGVAHDFNNMLGVIIGYAHIAMEQVGPANPIFDNLQQIRDAAERSAALTRQLLAFASKQTISQQVLDLNATVESMLKMLRRLIGEDIDLAWRPGKGLWPLKADPSQIDQILANLCINARDAIAGVGKITIETGAVTLDAASCANRTGLVPGEYLFLAVSDDGCGIDKNSIDRIFEPFFTTKAMGKGTGLGLATVYGIVKQNNGSINVYSEPGHGTTFKIYLPRYAGEAGPGSPEVPPEQSAQGRETILLVEDERAIMNMTTMMLKSQGYTVLAAGAPGEALRLAAAHPGEIHLLMTDVVMPEMNGRDLAGRLAHFYPKIKYLFMSGYTANVIAHHGVLDQGVHFLQKPFSMGDLAAKVREALAWAPALEKS